MSELNALLEKLAALESSAREKMESATLEELETLRVEWLGKKGALTDVMKNLGSLGPEDKPKIGARANEIRALIQEKLDARMATLKSAELEGKLVAEKIDVTLAGRVSFGRFPHPVQIVWDQLVEILGRCGFVTEVGPEIEHEFYNFDALNIPENHPSRAMQDTFYIKGVPGVVLRTHTSPVQARTMLKQKPPIRMICPGRVYRSDYDATHSPMFHQIEGLLVDENVNMGDLKGILATMFTEFFGQKLSVRLRPSFFPFTEPSAEVDLQCCFCLGKGCHTCKQSGWIEMGGCGMVDPEVFKACHIDMEKYRGFAFGMGIDRMAMLKFGINDLRSFFESDHRYISQFARWDL